jgi:hypothetical protein
MFDPDSSPDAGSTPPDAGLYLQWPGREDIRIPSPRILAERADLSDPTEEVPATS